MNQSRAAVFLLVVAIFANMIRDGEACPGWAELPLFMVAVIALSAALGTVVFVRETS